MSKSKTVLITGAASGFGRDMAETLPRAGYTVFASMRDVKGQHRDQANELAKQGIAVVELDVTNDASVDNAVKEVLAHTRRIDVLVNNAGIGSGGVTEAFTAEQAKVIFDTNVIGLLRTNSSGHDLCWHHPTLWGLLPEQVAPEVAVPPWPKFLRGRLAYREALDRELPAASIADVEYES